MRSSVKSQPETELDLGDLSLEEGGAVLIDHALRRLNPGARISVRSTAADFAVHMAAWARQKGCHYISPDSNLVQLSVPQHYHVAMVTATRAGDTHLPAAEAPMAWGLAARGANVEQGITGFFFPFHARGHIWSKRLSALYARAVAQQWNTATAIDWSQKIENPPELEDAVVQVMTYLIENETAALIIPARFASQIHPQYFETMQLLAIQAADEARHIEVFRRRATCMAPRLGFSSAGGQASLKTLIDEPDFSLAGLLLSVMGEGSFLSLLHFLQHYGPDPLTRRVCALAAKDEARHVQFAMLHLTEAVEHDRQNLTRFAAAIERRHAELTGTAGLNEAVFQALVILAAGSLRPAAIREGHRAVKRLERLMHIGRVRRLEHLGFEHRRAETLSTLHTRNFM